jgi:hypothetical protein
MPSALIFWATGFFELALDPDEGLVLVGQLLVQFASAFPATGPAQPTGPGPALTSGMVQMLDAGTLETKQQPITGWPRLAGSPGFQQPHLVLALKIVGIHLIGRPRQAAKCQRSAATIEFVAPHRVLLASSGPRCKERFFVHGRAFSSKKTGCVFSVLDVFGDGRRWCASAGGPASFRSSRANVASVCFSTCRSSFSPSVLALWSAAAFSFPIITAGATHTRFAPGGALASTHSSSIEFSWPMVRPRSSQACLSAGRALPG